MKVYILGVLFLISYVHSADLRIDPLVLISQGIVQGQRAKDGDYTTFLGIPYAVVDQNNPFGPSLPHTKFDEEVYKAYNGSVKCPQTAIYTTQPNDDNETLDCLRLNIYVPNEATSQNPLPVLVWIHGGRFIVGSAGKFGGRELAKQGVIVVTVNYRLGAYGFMSLDVPTVTGNQGLKDQFTALRWIRNNIRSFGGNPYNVTLAGQSAGACSVLLHMFSSKEKLFHKAIVQSGTPEHNGMFVNGDTQAAIKLANHLGFNTADTSEALEYLAKVPHRLVTGATSALNLELRPSKERSFSGIENFVDSDPYSLSNERKIRNTPILIGRTSKEELNSESIGPGYFDSDPILNIISTYFNFDNDKLNSVASTIRHYYLGDRAITEEERSSVEYFESDFYFNHPIERTITKLLKEGANPVFEYVFSYVGDSGAEGAAHSAELQYLFDLSTRTNGAVKNDEELVLTNQITTLWANFIKSGNPTPPGQNPLPVTWSPVNLETRPYLNIDKEFEMDSRAFHERMAFWELFHDHYGSYNVIARQCK